MLACPICNENYDSTEKIPKLLPKCAHTICLKCLRNALGSKRFVMCPKCQEPISREAERLYQTNFALQEALEILNSLCEKHQAPKNFVCLADSKRICINCIKDDHADHHVKSLQEIQTQAKSKIQEIHQKGMTFNNEKEKFSSVLKDSQSQINALVQQSFHQLTIDDKRKKRSLKWDIEAMFLMKQKLAEAQNLQIASFKNDVLSSCRTLENNVITTKYLEILQKAILSPVSVQKESNPDWNNQLEQKVKQEVGKIFSEENSILEKDYLHELCERSDLESLRLVLNFAQRRYFEMDLDDQQTLSITPKNPGANFKNILTTEQISKIKKVVFKQKEVKFTHDMISVLPRIWKNFSPDIEVKMAFDGQYFQDADLIQCTKLTFWESHQSLKKLEMDFTKCSFNELTSFTDFLCTALNKSLTLKAFGIVLDATNIDNLTIKNLSNVVLPLMPHLDEVSLSLNGTKITNIHQAFCSQLPKLQGLKLSLRNTNLSESSFSTFPDLAIQNLQELLFDVGHAKIAPSEINNLLKNLANFPKLEKLKLSLAGMKIEECHIELLSRYFSESDLSLKHLSLDLEQSDVSKNSLKTLCSNLPKQISELIFSLKKTRATDKVIRIFVKESLKKTLNLTLLHFSVADTKATMRSLSPLCSFLGNNGKIKNSKLDFRVTPSSHPHRYPCGKHH